MRHGFAALALVLSVSSCERPPPPTMRYYLGTPYQAGGVWFYPKESYSAVETGLAAVASPRHAARTADGEAYDPTALAAGHQTVQLPAVARVTNLENGLQIAVRINDRGPARVARLIELTPRAAELLGIAAAGGTQIRVEMQEAESRAAIEGLPGAPHLAITAAPRGEVRAESLDAPNAQPQASTGPAAAPARAEPELPAQQAAPPRLPEALTRTTFGPGSLYIRLGSFSRAEFADRQRARVAGLAPEMSVERNGRQTTYRLRIGPLPSAARADSVLEQAIRAGIPDARIVVE